MAIKEEAKKTAAAAKTAEKKAAPKAKAAAKPVKAAPAKAEKKVEKKAAPAKKAEKKVEKKAAPAKKPAAKKAAKLEIYVQSPYGGNITPAQIAAKVPAGCDSVFVRVDQNKLWWIKGEDTGSVEIW